MELLTASCENELQPPPEMVDVSELTDHYNSTMPKIINNIAPLKLKRIQVKDKNPWFNGSLNEERQKLRLSERKWRRLPSPHLNQLRKSRKAYNKSVHQAKKAFCRNKLDNAKNRPRKL